MKVKKKIVQTYPTNQSRDELIPAEKSEYKEKRKNGRLKKGHPPA